MLLSSYGNRSQRTFICNSMMDLEECGFASKGEGESSIQLPEYTRAYTKRSHE